LDPDPDKITLQWEIIFKSLREQYKIIKQMANLMQFHASVMLRKFRPNWVNSYLCSDSIGKWDSQTLIDGHKLKGK